jgi:tetratricopeptide (TPR) repeat protein
LRVADFDMEDVDMLIGIDYFLSHRIYVARSQRRMYFTYSGGPVFDLSVKMSEASTPGQDDGIPKDAAGFAHRGAVLFARGEYPSALAELDRACEMAPTVAKYFIQRGRIYAFMQQFLKAMSDYDQAVRLDPSDHTARLERARIRVALHEINSALEDLQILTQALPMQSNMRRDIGDIYVAAALPRLAIPQFNLWIAGHGDDVDKPAVLNARCWARALVGSELDKAVEDCNAAVRAKPKDAAFLDSRGLVYLRQGKLSDAMKDYDAALKLNPKIAWSLYGRGLIQQRMGKNDLANADIASAKQVRPSIEEEVTRYGVVIP